MRKNKRTVFGYSLDSLWPPVDQGVNRPRSGTHRERGDLHRMMNEPSHNAARGADQSFIVILGFGSGISKAEFDRLSSGSWRGHTHHDELDAPYRDMCRDIMLLVPHQHFSPQCRDATRCFSALRLRSVLLDKFSIHTYYTVARDPICPCNIVRRVVSGIDLKREILRRAGNKLLFT